MPARGAALGFSMMVASIVDCTAWPLLGVLLLSFFHEDVALVAGALLVSRLDLPPVLVGGVLFGGAVLGDVGIYAMGAAARSVPWLRRLVIGPNVASVRDWLDGHFLRVVLVARIVPGVLFPSYLACGWTGLAPARFFRAILLADALYTGIVFAALVRFGRHVLRHLGLEVWAALAVVLLVVTALRARRPMWRVLARASTAQPYAAVQALWRRQQAHLRRHHRGMPSIDALKRKVARAEHIPPWLFYIPLGAYWLWLSARYHSATLPTAANPRLETGGFWGESKSLTMRQIGLAHQDDVAPFITVDIPESCTVPADGEAILRRMSGANLSFPVVAKPDIGWQGFGVRLVATPEALFQYLALYPRGQRLILQRLVPYDGEAGVFYVRMPGEAEGGVRSLTLRYYPYVVGDGHAPLRALIRRDPRTRFRAGTHLGERSLHAGLDPENLQRVPEEGEVVRLSFIGSLRVGGLYRDATGLITPALSRKFDAIARSMPDFHFGRFDIRFESIERLQAGEGFQIFEVNGAGAEAIQLWDPEWTLSRVYRELFQSLALLFRIGHANRARGARPCSAWEFLAAARRQHRLDLWYPPSN